jgi:hypothetical protein
MNVSDCLGLFETSFGSGQFNVGHNFSYKNCVIDLNPDVSKYNPNGTPDDQLLVEGKFPMSFASSLNVNTDEYKTSKLVLQRIDSISGEKFDSFEFGSKAEDYEEITNPLKLKYKDAESIVSGSSDDFVQVTLGNGGSYQKRCIDYSAHSGEAHPANDLYGIPRPKIDDLTGRTVVPEKAGWKYVRNKHFFIAPFELTIAQWCYVKLNSNPDGIRANQDNARELLSDEGHLSEMEKSYWKYLSVWEKDDWRKEISNWIGQDETPDEVAEFIGNWKTENEGFIEEWKQSNPKGEGETDDVYAEKAK